MSRVMLQQLREHPDELIRRVEEDGETIEIVNAGRIVATIAPPPSRPVDLAAVEARLARLDALAAEIGAHWPAGVSAVEAVREQRRDL